jgi:hypothetical protein
MRHILAFSVTLLISACAVVEPVELKPPATSPGSGITVAGDAALLTVRKKILILPFLNQTPYKTEILIPHVTTELENAILRVPDLVPVRADSLDDSDTFVTDGAEYNYRVMFARARALGFAAVIGGSIDDIMLENHGDSVGLFRTQEFTATANVKLNLWDTSTEKPLIDKTVSEQVIEERSLFFWGQASPENEDTERGKVAVTKALEKCLGNFADTARRIAWAGRIAKADVRRYYINAGEASGISLGQLLKVFEESRPIIDPQSGLFIGMAPGRFKGILKVVDHFGADGAIAVPQSGGGFREKDRVEIHSPPQYR